MQSHAEAIISRMEFFELDHFEIENYQLSLHVINDRPKNVVFRIFFFR